MTARTPQLIVSLMPDGQLTCELPGAQGTRRKVILTGNVGETLRRILEGQAREGMEIGEDGAPTAAQVKHWEKHVNWPDERCRFCIAEGRIKPAMKREKRHTTIMNRSDGVEVRVYKAREGQSGTEGEICKAYSPEDLGL